ncbi:EpsG family protein [Shewanella mangrovisoli]|uniref:EpsG family protein n=1 Tax=Shewanella mangrovisoli TaxID=2864211 RepID=UPI0035BB3754
MAYLFVFAFSFLCVFLYDKGDQAVKLISLLIFFFTLLFIPSFQYGIGTDYFTYFRIVDDVSYIDFLKRKGELFFYYIYSAINYLGLPNQSIFIITATVQLLLLLNILKKLSKREGYCVIWFFIGYFLITNYYHNQMNQLRSYTSIMFFINALLYRFDKKYFTGLIFCFFAVISHASAIALIPLLFLNQRISRFVLEYRYLVVFLSCIIFSLNIYKPILFFLVEHVFPFYNGYIHTLFNESDGLLDVASKLYYFPIILYVLLFVGKERQNFTDFDNYLFSFFLLTCVSYLLLMQSTVFLRFWIFFIILYPLVLSRMFDFKNDKRIHSLFWFLYLLTPYIFKVVIFPVREFDLKLIFMY